MKYLLYIIPFLASAFISWVFWFPIRLFVFSLIPQTAEYAWAGKLLALIAIGYFGGIGLPIVVFAVCFGIITAILFQK